MLHLERSGGCLKLPGVPEHTYISIHASRALPRPPATQNWNSLVLCSYWKAGRWGSEKALPKHLWSCWLTPTLQDSFPDSAKDPGAQGHSGAAWNSAHISLGLEAYHIISGQQRNKGRATKAKKTWLAKAKQWALASWSSHFSHLSAESLAWEHLVALLPKSIKILNN